MARNVIVNDLRKRYAGIEAVRGVSFEIEEGEIFGFLGPNGAGKTTSLECLLGLREPDAGTIQICGIDARKDPRGVKQRIGAALQTTSLQDKITPREALRLFASFYERSASADELIARFGLGDKADAHYDSLSGGQRQRLALALAFVNRPDLVFLDEPTTGLDPQSRRGLHAEIARMKGDGHTVLLTTHYIEEAELLCDRIAIIHQGKIIATGAPRELIGRFSPSQSVRLETTRPLDAAILARLPAMEGLTLDGNVARFRTARIVPALAELIRLLEAQKIEVVDLHVQKATLEDVFISLTGAQLTP